MNFTTEVTPFRIGAIYQNELFLAAPVLELFLARDSVGRCFARFDIDQSMDVVLGRVMHQSLAMLLESSW